MNDFYPTHPIRGDPDGELRLHGAECDPIGACVLESAILELDFVFSWLPMHDLD